MKRKEKAAVDEFVALVGGARHGSLYAINVWVNGVV